MTTRNNSPGFLYITEYIGDTEILKGKKYAGCSTWKRGWEKYYGSPSSKYDAAVDQWYIELKTNPNNFKRTIVRELVEGNDIVEEEIKLLSSLSEDIITDPIWLNRAIPRVGGFPHYKPTPEEKLQIQNKRETTNIQRYGVKSNYCNAQWKKDRMIARYGTSNYNKTPQGRQKVSKHRKEYFGSLTPDQLLEHGAKSKAGRTLEGVEAGNKKRSITRSKRTPEQCEAIEIKRRAKWEAKYRNRTNDEIQQTREKCAAASQKRPQYYLTIQYNDTGEVISDYLKNLPAYGFALDGIKHRMKTDISKPLYSRTVKRHITILKVEKRADSPSL